MLFSFYWRTNTDNVVNIVDAIDVKVVLHFYSAVVVLLRHSTLTNSCSIVLDITIENVFDVHVLPVCDLKFRDEKSLLCVFLYSADMRISFNSQLSFSQYCFQI